MGTESTKLLSYILEKERKEKAAKRRKLIIGACIVLALGTGGVIAGTSLYSPPVDQELSENIRGFSTEELSLQKVANLLDENPEGIKVMDPSTGNSDTIRSVNEFTLLAAAIADDQEEIIPNEGHELARNEPSEPFTPTVALTRSQDEERSEAIDPDKPRTEADIMPSYPGGEAALYQFLSKQIRYPRQAVRNKIEGTVYVRFIIQQDGKIAEAEVMRGIGHGCDEEALRVVQGMPDWNPGELKGQKVSVYSSLAVNFKFL